MVWVVGEGCPRALKALLVLCVQLSLSSTTARDERPVSWAVKLGHEDATEPGDLVMLATELAREQRLELVGRVDPFPDVFELRLPQNGIWKRAQERGTREVDSRSIEDTVHEKLSGHPVVKWTSKQVPLKRTKRGFSDPAFDRQWHLVNKLEKGHDTNVSGVWREGVSGAGVTIAVVDDGVERLNPDLIENYSADGSHDYNDNDADPTPNLKAKYDNSHGTKCAGLIAAGANKVCGVGVAYGAKVAGIRMLDGTVTDILEGKSFIHKAHVNWIYSCSWGPEDDGKTLEGPGYVAREAMELAINKGRYGYGNIFVFASGNGGVNGDNCNFDGYANSIYTITIGAVDEKNNMPYYAELCSAMLGVTYSNGHSNGDRMVVTTDATIHSGSCTYSFSGTSASAPIASGMIALMLETRNCLTWRDVQHILVYTAVMVDASHAQWVENGAGFNHSNQHGFGLLDAYRMTRVAGLWPLVPSSVSQSFSSGRGSWSVSNHQPTMLTQNIIRDDLSDGLSTLEYVTVTLSLRHSRRGQLSVFLKSPHGTTSTLATPRDHDRSHDGFKYWTFSTVKFWAESPLGLWTLNITQTSSHVVSNANSGTVTSWTLTLHGTAIDPEEVQHRRRLVEEAVATPTWSPIPCPDLPAHPKELHLADLDTSAFPMWKKVLLVIATVLIVALIVHCVSESVCERVRTYHRSTSSLPSVKYTRLDNNLGGDSRDGDVDILASSPAMLPVEVNELPHISHDNIQICHDNLPILDHTPFITEQLPVNVVQETSGEQLQEREGDDDEDSIPDRLEQKPLLDTS